MGCLKSKDAQDKGAKTNHTKNTNNHKAKDKLKDDDSSCSSGEINNAADDDSKAVPQDDEGDFRDEYDMFEELGAGTFGVVYACTKKSNGKKLAVKLMEHEADEANWELFVQESQILRMMNHNNVIRIYDIYFDDSFTYVVMDKLGCDLMCAVKNVLDMGSLPPRNTLVSTFKQMMLSIQYIQSKKIIHRDVKADNYLVDSPDLSGNFRVVLTDFGTAMELEFGVCLTEQLGTKRYWAPEMVTREYDHAVDVWAVGITLFGCSTGSFPFSNDHDIVNKEIVLPKSVKKTLGDLLLRLLDKNPRKRINPDTALTHIWVQRDGDLDTSSKGKGSKREEQKATQEEALALKEFLKEARQKMEVPDEVAKRREKRLKEINRLYQQGVKTSLKAGRGRKIGRRASSGGRQEEPADEEEGFSTAAALGDERRYWEWWPLKKCIENEVEFDHDDKEASDNKEEKLKGMQMVKLEWTKRGIHDLLKKYGVNINAFGKGDAKSLANIEKEILSGESYLAEGNGKLTRIVDIIVMRLMCPTGRYLIETRQQFPDGRVRDRNLLPGAMKRPTEDQMATVRRIIQQELHLNPDTVKFMGAKFSEILEETKTSPSYPGLISCYRKVFIEGFVNEKTSTREDLKTLGYPDWKGFTAKLDDGTLEQFKWWTEQDCEARGVALHGTKTDTSSLPGVTRVQLLPWDEQVLKETLQKFGVDVKRYGQGKARSITDFSRELCKGESQLVGGGGGTLLRLVDLIVLHVKKNDMQLVEAYHMMGNRKRERKVLPGTKRRHDEDVLQAARRLMGEIKIPYNLADFSIGRKRFEEMESPSYPGIKTVYAKQHVEAKLLGKVSEAVSRRFTLPANFGSKKAAFLEALGVSLADIEIKDNEDVVQELVETQSQSQSQKPKQDRMSNQGTPGGKRGAASKARPAAGSKGLAKQRAAGAAGNQRKASVEKEKRAR